MHGEYNLELLTAGPACSHPLVMSERSTGQKGARFLVSVSSGVDGEKTHFWSVEPLFSIL